MNSFKKIAAALVATLAASTIIATPASATGNVALTVGATVVSATANDPALIPVPESNTIVDANVLEIALTGLETGTVVSATATNGRIVTALATTAAPVTASAGSATAVVNTGTGTTATLYVFTTNVNPGTVAVTRGGTTTTYHFRGVAGALHTIELSGASFAGSGTVYAATVRGLDVFGNAKGGAAINLQVVTNTASTTYALTTDTATATLGTKRQEFTLPTSGTVRLVATANVAAAVTGLATPVGVRVADVTVRDFAAELAAEQAARQADKAAADKALADAVAAKDAEIAKLKAENAAALVALKKAFNNLAKRWNKRNPNARVKLIK